MSPESVSSLFPQRPMRPLPKRRLRERLSPEVADSIQYPPANQNASPLFYYPNIVRDDVPSRTIGLNGVSRGGIGYESSPRGHTGNGESDEEELALSSSKVVRRSHPEILNRASTMPPKADQSKHPNPKPPPSTTSSADGYESFENTNNKKKRKIPTAGDSALSGVHSLVEINAMGVSAATTPSNEHGDMGGSGSSSYYGNNNFVANNQGISGPGRGRFGRSRSGRSPLRALSDAANNWVGRGAKIRPLQWATSNEHRGIISSAIANAGKVPSPPGQENVSLLQQHSATGKPSPTATQFTFTCDSPVPKARWPGTDPYPGSLPTYSTGSKLRQIQMTTPAFAEPGGVGAGPAAVAPTGNGGTQPGTSKKKSRRRTEKELLMAAKKRRAKTEENNFHNPPKPEDIWICEFCEYEQIFGEPPRALIRQYEIRDQKARRQEEERKRLLEKAKAKSRKGKKPAKSPAKTSSPQNQHTNTSDVPLPLPMGQGDAAHEDYTNDEYTHDDYSNDPEDELDDSYSQEDPPMILSDDPDQEDPDCTDPDCLNCRGRVKEVDDPGDSLP
ncbi:hypothetical protein CPLU01_04030 [Colletotrichum plurivorum]|uniref:Uncharacterized protein n=1 Tax=Colletotrichum plurivorum TaxID=2175906 RepID=A0A8H6KQQ3_9PEZI|nr:hypothetical protein CPLU01_04030 [Colletotrichum plurivorum]